MSDLPKTYDHHEVEQKWYEYWEKGGFFSHKRNADNENAECFSVVMPPPNVTGQLHLGHAMDNTMQDILTRWHRMQGHQTLWVPGSDHAGIATQAKVEEHLAKNGVSKYDLGREAFVDKVWDWKHQYHGRIVKQLKMLGSSCDWEQERFTLDDGCNDAVNEVFVRLYNEGLIYRGTYIINWCPHCHTTISDIEVEHNEHAGHLWHFRYPLTDGSGYITIATTRPETMLGDTAVAVHPEDERYKDLVGKTLMLPLVNREIPIIADAYVDKEYGTGAVKITPAHDPNDFEMGLRHNLPQITVIGKDAKMNEQAGEYAGMDRYECRKAVVEAMDKLGLLEKIEDISHAVGECYRCGSIIEPLISPQWFVKMEPLAKPAIEAVKNGDIRFVPARFAKIYLGWLENIRDWCISRQLWWGHRIPVWYCDDCGEVICQKDEPQVCPKCGSAHLHRDEDVLDTWFSSGLWPFETLGWPDMEKMEPLKKFYPTSVLVTGRDIIFFWVARMIFTGLHFMQEKPFSDVFIHGLILDAQGRKMSKSLGNGIDPIEIIEKYGADPLRFMLVTGNTPGNDLRFQMERLESCRNFVNKIWNASRFVLMNLEDYQAGEGEVRYSLADKWILSELKQAAAGVSANLAKYELGEAARQIYDFTWDCFCDWYIEMSKPRLYGSDAIERHTAQTVLVEVLTNILQLLHPFMPFITEEIWQALPHEGESIMVSAWPQAEQMPEYPEEAAVLALDMEAVRAIRNIRAEMNVPPGKKIELVFAADEKAAAGLQQGGIYIRALCGADKFSILPANSPELAAVQAQAAVAHVRGIDIYLPLKELIDLSKETARLQKEVANMDKEIKRLEGKLNNQGFLSKAPADVVEGERVKLADYSEKKASLLERLAQLEQM